MDIESREIKKDGAMKDFNSDDRIAMLKRRTKRCVCKFCGGNLRLKRIIFSSYESVRVEIFCEKCNRIEFGVEPEIYLSSKYFVEESKINMFPDLEENERTKQMNIAKICEIMNWGNMNLGLLDKEGFTVPLNINENFLGECITLKEKDLAEVIKRNEQAAQDGGEQK